MSNFLNVKKNVRTTSEGEKTNHLTAANTSHNKRIKKEFFKWLYLHEKKRAKSDAYK